VTVTFNANAAGVANPAPRTLPAGNRLGTLPTPVRNGHIFAGWFTAQTGGVQVNVNTVVNNNVTYWARWNTRVTLNVNGGTGAPNFIDVPSGQAIGNGLPTPTRAGHIFVGWYTLQPALFSDDDLYMVDGEAAFTEDYVSALGNDLMLENRITYEESLTNEDVLDAEAEAYFESIMSASASFINANTFVVNGATTLHASWTTPSLIRGTKVIECFCHTRYIDIHTSATSTTIESAGKSVAERPIWNFVYQGNNIYAIRNDTTGRYFTESNGNLNHSTRISRAGESYDDRQLWFLIAQSNGAYRIRSVSNNTLYVAEGTHTLILARRNNNNDRQLWRVGFIWHVDSRYENDPALANWVGYWDGTIYMWTVAVGPQPAGFNFGTRMTTARNAWRGALGVRFDDATRIANANIRAYGGHREDIQSHLERSTPFPPNDFRYGITWENTASTRDPQTGRRGTILAGGVTRNVFRFTGTGNDAMIMAVFTDNGERQGSFNQRNIDFATMSAMQELGHSLGYIGHPTNLSDVMIGVIPNAMRNPNINLRPAEIEHLRQIYQRRYTSSR